MNLTHAMIFAAGLGTRMMPLTANRPKPMIEVRGQPLLGHAIDKVERAGIPNVVINTHYKAEAVQGYVASRTTPQIQISHEDVLLETGGGVKKALPLLGKEPFLAVNSDILVDDIEVPAITRLQQAWDPAKMDVLLLLTPKDKAWGNDSSKGDYNLAPDGRIQRLSNDLAPYLYAGLQITKPELYRDANLPDKFSNLVIFDQAEKAGRLFGVVHDGRWFHFSTPQAVNDFAHL